MLVESCIPVIPSADLARSLRFWVDGLGLSIDRPMSRDDRLVGCMVHNERLYFWLNQRAGSPVKPDQRSSAPAIQRTPQVTNNLRNLTPASTRTSSDGKFVPAAMATWRVTIQVP